VTMAKRVDLDLAKRTAQFAELQDDIAMLFDSSSGESSSDSSKTEVEKQERVKQVESKEVEKATKRKKAKELTKGIEADKVCQAEEENAFKTDTQGKAPSCSMCKKAGMPETKWKSCHTNDCTNQGDHEQKLSSNAKSNSNAKSQYKREIYKLQKAAKAATSKLKKVVKAAKSSKELRKFQKSLSKGKKKRSKSTSSEDSDESGQISESPSSSNASDRSLASSF